VARVILLAEREVDTPKASPSGIHLDDDLWELREESSTNIYRVIYFFFTGRRIVFLHGFQKKTRKTPAQELTMARKRAVAFRVREERRQREDA